MKPLKRYLPICFLLPFCAQSQQPASYYYAHSPFPMSQIEEPKIPQKKFSINDFGAIGDGKTLNTDAFAKAINTVSQAGGGILTIPKGIWLTGPIEIKSNLELHLEDGALVQFSPNLKDYPVYEIGNGKFEVLPPIYGTKLSNVAFTGNGVFDGSGQAWRPVKKNKLSADQWSELVSSGGVLSDDGKVWWPTAQAKDGVELSKKIMKDKSATKEDYEKIHDFLRPKMFTLSKVKNLLIDGVTFRNSPHFIINPKQITNLIIRNATVYNPSYAQNGDGIDISASENVLIYNTKVNAGDDGICMKSSGGNGGEALLKNIIIAECTVNQAHGGFVIGSNTDGGMKNIYVSNCTFDGTDNGIRVKSNSGRGGDVSNIFIDNIKMPNILQTAILFDSYYDDAPVGSTKSEQNAQHSGDKVPFFHQFFVSNIQCDKASTAFLLRGLAEQPIKDLSFKNVQIQANKPIEGENATNILFENVKINGATDFKIPSALKTSIIIK